jgi:preprotein translocase subunit SecA
LREHELDEREKDLAREAEALDRQRKHSASRRPTTSEMDRLADRIEPPDPGPAMSLDFLAAIDPSIFKGVGRNDRCPCGSGKKYKVCHLPVVSTTSR